MAAVYRFCRHRTAPIRSKIKRRNSFRNICHTWQMLVAPEAASRPKVEVHSAGDIGHVASINSRNGLENRTDGARSLF
jgi:hypothetical protein